MVSRWIFSMCTIAIIVDTPLVLAANRDEFYARPTRPPERVGDTIAGTDEISGGTWLAVRTSGRFAAVTNQRAQPPTTPVRSRGLVVRELAAAADPDAYVAALDPHAYASMNLVWGDFDRVSIAYLRHDGGKEIVKLEHGIHVLTNDRLHSPAFPRAAWIADEIARGTPLPQILGDHRTFESPIEPPAAMRAFARELSATCIHTPVYGTRSSTVVTIERTGLAGYRHADGPPCITPYVEI